MSRLARRQFFNTMAMAAAGGLAGAWALRETARAAETRPTTPGKRLNILLLTADDMNFDTLGVTGCKTPDITPNLDRLAREGLLFEHAHVTVAVCQPSRECLMTGRYPHHNGATGFYPVRNDVPTLMEALKAAGYMQGILGKVTHLAPPEKFPWNFKHDQAELGMGRDPAIYYKFAAEFFASARQAGKPFFLMANSHDPHRPWAGSDAEKSNKPRKGDADVGENPVGVYPPASRYYRPDEVVVPGFLPDLPEVRTEMAQYYSSAHRCDQTVGQVLKALKEAGREDDTLVMFLSDNGISMPFAKSNCYLTSTHTPWIVRWPGKVKSGGSGGGAVDAENFISGIDFMPTILEILGLPLPEGLDGTSFLPLLSGGHQDGRDRVFTVYNDTSAKRSYPMRCLQDRQYGYIFNAWSDGQTVYQGEPTKTPTFEAMRAAATTQKAVADRVEMLQHRVPEELYDLRADPDALHNLIDQPAHKELADTMRKEMLAWMQRTGDPQLEAYRKRLGRE